MNLLHLALSTSTSGLLGMLLWVAIAVIIFAAIVALIRWSGLVIPPPVMIVLWALAGIFLILFLFRAFAAVSP